MIASVSTLLRSSGATSPSRTNELVHYLAALSGWPGHPFDVLADLARYCRPPWRRSGNSQNECDHFFMLSSSEIQFTHVGEMAGNRRSGGHRGLTRWVRPPGPGGLRNCGSRSRRSARPAPAGRRSSPGTSSSPARATRSRRRGRSCPGLRLGLRLTRPEPGTTSASLTLAATCGPWHAARRADPRCASWCTSR
jgi:hypothetical protein